MWVGPTTDDGVSTPILRGRRPPRRDLPRGCATCATQPATRSATRYPDIPRRVSGYNLDSLLPENGFDLARALVGSEGTLVTVLHAELELVAGAQGASAWSCSATPTSPPRPTPCPRSCRTSRSQLEGVDQRADPRSSRPSGLHARGAATSCPTGGGWLMVQFAGDDPGRGRRARPQRLLDDLRRTEHDAARRVLRRPGASEDELWRGPRGRPRRDRPRRPARPDTWPGLGGLRGRRRTGSATTCATCARCSTSSATTSGRAVRALRPGLRAHPDPLRPASPPTASPHFRAFMERAADLVVSYGGSLSGEHGDGQARGELLPSMFGARGRRRVRRGQGDLRPGRPDEPRQGRRTPTGSTSDLRLGRRLAAAPSRTTLLPLPRRRRPLRAGRAALRRRRQVPQPTSGGR